MNVTGEAAQAAGKVAGTVAEGVSVVGENVASSDAGKAAKEIANTAAQGLAAAGSAFAESDAGKAAIGLAGAATSAASQVAHTVADTAGQAASAAGGAIDAGIKAIQENSFSARLKRERSQGFATESSRELTLLVKRDMILSTLTYARFAISSKLTVNFPKTRKPGCETASST